MAEEEEAHRQQAIEEEKELKVSPSAQTIHDIIYKEGENELKRSTSNLFWSGLAAGLSMSFSLIAKGILEAYLPDAEWTVLLSSLGYSMGFIIVILGKQQLFTENTLTPILPLIHSKTFSKFMNVMRLWGVVLVANLLGAVGVALVIAYTSVFDHHVLQAFEEIGMKAMEPGFGTILLRGIFAGWLIALMIWLIPYAESARIWVILLITYMVGIGHFSHVIAGSIEVYTLAAMQQASWIDVLLNYSLPALIGNILGGVVLAAALNHAQAE